MTNLRKYLNIALSLIALSLCMPQIGHARKVPVPTEEDETAVLAQGYNSDTGKFAGQCVTGDTVFSGRPESNVNFSQTVSKRQMSEQLGFGASGKAKYGAASYSASAQFMKSTASTGFSISAVYSGNYRFKNMNLVNVRKSATGTSIGNNDINWMDGCGDEYIQQVVQGARLHFLININFSTKDERDSFEAKFKFKSSMASAAAYLKKSKKNFSQHTSVKIGSLQVGGDVDKVTEIFQKADAEGAGALGFVQCTFGDFSKCDDVLAQAINYATNTQTGFPSQLSANVNGGLKRADLKYIAKSYATAGIFPTLPSIVTKQIVKARRNLDRYFDAVTDPLNRARAIVNTGVVTLSPRQHAAISDEIEKLAQNLEHITDVAITCYEKPTDCLDQITTLDQGGERELKSHDASVFNISPETFLQYCQVADSVVATKEIKSTVRGLIAAAKEMSPDSFIPVSEDDEIDVCQATNTVIAGASLLNLNNKGIYTLEPLEEFTHFDELDLSNNNIRDLSPLSKMKNLEILNARRNKLKSLAGLETLSSLKRVNVSTNFIKDSSALNTLPSLERIDLRGNFSAIRCPDNPSVLSCLVSSAQTVAQFISSGQVGGLFMYRPKVSKLNDGSFLITGIHSQQPLSRGLMFDPTTERFRLTEATSFNRVDHTSTLLQDGRVLITGGWGALTRLEIYDPETNQFELLAVRFQQPRAGHTATLLNDGRVLIAGGFRGNNGWTDTNPSQSAEIFDPANGSLKSVRMETPRGRHTATVLTDGRVLLAGGYSVSGAQRSAEIFNPETNSFSLVRSFLTDGRGAHTATRLPDGRVLLVGGLGMDHTALSSAEAYNEITGEFEFLYEKMISARAHHTATLTPSGKVILIGGLPQRHLFSSISDVCSSCMASGEIFDSSQFAFEEIRNTMTAGKAYHAAALGPNGQVFAIGGITRGSARLYETLIYKEVSYDDERP